MPHMVMARRPPGAPVQPEASAPAVHSFPGDLARVSCSSRVWTARLLTALCPGTGHGHSGLKVNLSLAPGLGASPVRAMRPCGIWPHVKVGWPRASADRGGCWCWRRSGADGVPSLC